MNMEEKDKLRVLYDGVSSYMDIGNYDDFKNAMRDTSKRQKFFDGVSSYMDIGTNDQFNSFMDGYFGQQQPAPRVDVSDVVEKPSYEEWYKTVPADRNDTANYDLRRAYELLPQEQLEQWRTALPEDLDKNHLPSVAYNGQADEYEFLKGKDHPTVQKELDWYNSDNPEAVAFRKEGWRLDNSGDRYRYVRDGEKKDNEPASPYGDLTSDNFVAARQRGSEIAARRKEIQRALDSDTEMEPLTLKQRNEYERQLKALDNEMNGINAFVDEWNKTEEAKAYYDAQKRAVDDVSARVDQMQADRNRERSSKKADEEGKKGFWQRFAEGLAAAENLITEETVAAITDPTNNDLRTARNEVRNAKNQLRLEEMRMNGEQRGLGFLRGMETANYYELMPAIGMADAMSILQLSKDIKDGKELTDSQKLLKEAMEARAGVDFAYQDNNTLWERIGQSAPEQLMFTLQFVIGAGVTGATSAGERVAARSAERAAKRLAKKEATSAARNFVGTRVLPELEGMAVSSAIQTFANPLSVAGMVEDFERRYAGDIYYDKEGNLHVFDNDRSAGQAAYQAIASAWIENFTEYAGGNITKSAKLLDSKMFDLAGKFDNVMKTVGAGKIQDVFRIPQQLGRLTQIGSAPEEFLEEELGSVMNALMMTDAQRGESYGEAFKNTTSSAFAGEQQLETFLSCAITSMLLGGGGNAVNGVRNAGLRKSVNQDVEQSKALLGKVRGIDIEGLDNMIENGRVSDISAYLKEQSDANNWNKDEQGAAVSYVLNRSRQIGVKHNDDTAIEAEQAEYRRQAEDMVNRWDGQNIYNVTYTDRNGETQEGTIVNGRVHYNTNEDGTYTFDPYMSSGMLAIRRADGSVEQVAGRNVTALNNVATIEEQLESQNQTIDQLMRAEFDQDVMLPTIESVWGGNLVPNVTQFQNGRYTYLGQDDNGLYAFANNDKRTSKDNPIIYLTERQLIEYGLSLNLENAQANGDTEAAQKAQEDIDFLKRLDEITADAGAKGQWDVVKAYAQRKVLFDANGGIIPNESNEQATAAYLLAISEGSFENAITSVDQTIAALGTPQQTEVTDNAADNAAMNNAAATVDADKARQIDFYTNVRNRLTEMQQGKEEADVEETEQQAANTPVSQMEVGQQFPVQWKGQPAMATVMGKDADGRSVVTVRDMDGEDIEAGIDDMSDAAWEGVRVQPQSDEQAPQQEPETTPVQPAPTPQGPAPVAPTATETQPVSQNETPELAPIPTSSDVAPSMEFPRDEEGNIDYEQITDPYVYAAAVTEEFGEDALNLVDSLIEGEETILAESPKIKDAIKRFREQRNAKTRLERFKKVRDILTAPQEQAETTTEETPVEQPMAETTQETTAEEAPIEETPSETPMESAEEGTEQEALAVEDSEETPSEVVETPIQKPKEQTEYQKRLDAVGEPRTLEEAILLDIARGGAKFRWGNRDEDKKVKKRGIGDLWHYDQKEFKLRFQLMRKDGFTIETYAEAIMQGQLQYLGGSVSQQAERMDFQDVVAAIEDVLQFVKTPTEALEAIESKRNEEADEEQRHIRSIKDRDAREQGFEDYDDMENYYNSLSENNLSDDDYNEINAKFAEQYQEENGRQGESETTGGEAEQDEQQGVRGESEGSDSVLQGEQPADEGTSEPARQGEGGERGDTTGGTPQGKEPEGAAEVRAEIDKLKAQRSGIVKQRDDIQRRYEQANGLFGDTQADEGDLFGGQNFLSPELAQTTIDGYNRQIKQIDEQIAKLEASLKRASSVRQTEIGVEETPKAEPKKPQVAATENTIFTEDEYQRRKEALKRRHRTELNIAINPQDFEDLLYMAGYHIEKGVRKFADFCKSMIEDLGDWVRPYLQTVYLGAKADDDIKKLGIDRKEWSSEDEVLDFDVDNFDKQQESETGAHQYTDQQKRMFSDAVRVDMRMALERGEKPYRSINDIRKRAESLGMEVDSEGRDDIMLQELVEDGLVRAAREVVESGRYGGAKSRDAFDAICQLYEMQPTISRRSANRVKMQQYSTPLPMSFVADMFAYRRGQKSVLEPTAGNGMLVFAVPAGVVTANELDETRLANLREQGFNEVTNNDATDTDFGGPFDAVIGNPPFGSAEAKEYDGVMIGGLEEQIVLNALQAMADNGRAAFIVGGNMEYAKNGGIAGNKAFWTYLYNHYNVKGVVDMDGKLYARQGTTFPTRMILIEGRRSAEEIAQSTIYPPVKEKSLRKAESFVDLYDIVKELNDSTNKTNGTEILRTPGAPVVPDSNRPSGETSTQRPRVEPNANVANEQGGPVGTGSTGGTGQTATTGVQRPATTGGTVDVGQRPASVSGTQTSQSGSGTRTGNGERGRTDGNSGRVSDGSVSQPGNATDRVGLTQQKDQEKRTLTEEKLPYRKHSGARSLESVAPAAMVEAMDRVLSEIEKTYGKSIDEFVREELGYDTDEELYNALAAEQIDSVAMAIHQMKQGNGMIIGDQTGVGKGRQMAALIRWAHNQGKKPVFITQKADLFTDIYRDLMDVGSGDLKPFIFNSDGAIVDSDGNVVHKPMSPKDMAKVFEKGELPDGYDYAVLTYSQVNTGDAISQEEAKNAAKESGKRGAKKSKSDGKPTPKATFLRQIAEDNYLFLDESHTAAGESNTGYYLQSIVRTSKAVTFASATFAKRPDTMPLYAIRTAMSQANVKPNELIGIIQKGGVTLQEIMSRALTEAGQMVRRERDMSDVQTDWETISDPATVKRARENYDKTIEAFNAIIRFQELYIKPLISQLDSELAEVASTANVKKGTNKMGVENTPFASKTYNYTKQLMLALKVDAIVDKVIAEIKAGRHPVIALESTMEASIRDYSPGDIISEPTFSASLLRGLETVMQYTITDAEGKDTHRRYLPSDLGPEGEKAYYELQDFIRESTSDIFISPLDAIIDRLRQEGYKVGELTGRNQYVERNDEGKVVVKRRTDKDKKRMQREFNSGELDVLILNKSASTGISLHASERFSDQRQRTMVIAQPLSDINDYMQMIGRIDRTGQVHRGYYINLGLPVPAENRFLMMLATKLKSLNANTTTSQESESNSVEAPDLLNKYGSQVVVEYLRDNPEVYVKMGEPIKEVTVNQLDDYTPPENDEVVRKITGYVALLSTKEQEDFYNDVVRRYIDLIKYLDDTGQNDLKITVMPLRAKTIERKVSSQGVDPNGTNPFAKDAFVETVEIDVLRKPMKADEVRKTIESLNTPKGTEKGHFPTAAADKTFGDRVLEILGIVQRETQAKLRDEEKRYEESKKIALEDIAKKSDKIRAQQKLSAEEKEQAIADYVAERNAQVEQQHERAVARIQEAERTMQSRLGMFVAGSSYLMPDQLNDDQLSSPELASPAIFLGYKAKESKVTPSTTFAVFATLDGRRRIELKLSDAALFTIRNMTRENYDLANRVTLDNWDSELPTSTRKNAIIMTGNILQAVSDTQDQNGNYPGQLISYTDENGDVHDGILMPDKWKPTMMKNSGVPINARLSQIEQGKSVASTDGKVTITKSRWSGSWLLTVPKSRKEGAVYFENPVILKVVGGFWQNRGQFAADINSVEDLRTVVNELANIGVKVTGEQNGGVELSVSNNDRSSIENTESQRIAFEAATTALARAGYEVVRATEEDIENLKKENKLLRKINGTINGWLGKDGRIYLTESGLNAETAVHEYTHLWAEALQLNDPGLWNEIKKLLKGTPTWNEVKNNPAYAKYDEDRLAEEVLAHLSGRDNGARMEAEAKRMIDEADTMADAAKAASMLNRLKEALKKFWTWVGKNLFGIKGKIDLDTVENMILADLVNGVNPFGPSGGRKKNTTEQSFTPAQPQNRIADEYNRMTGANVDDVNSVKRGWEKFARDQFDGLRPLEQMQQLIEKALGRKLRDSEKAYELATQLTSKTGQQIEREQLSYLVPVLQQVTDVIKALKGADGYPRDEAYEKVTNYMLAKHGLERNEWFEKQGKDEGDYAGLRGLAERLGYNPDDYKTAAEVTVRDMEDIMKVAGIDVNEFWKTVNALTNRMLEISYNTGMIDKDTYEELKNRHKYYVPLRGFADGTAADLFDYVTQSPHFQNIFKKATGRKSMADDPFANLVSMLHSSIVIGNQNQVMQKIYNMAVNSKSDLLRVTKPWYVYDDTTDTWEEKYPDIPEDATADDIDAIVKQFDADMQQKQQQGKAKRKLNRIDVGKKLLPYQAREHEMVAYIDGKRVVMHVAGNPLVAQAMNKSNTQQLNKVMQAVQTATRWYSSINTSWSPAFGPKNAMRDIRMMLFGAYVTGGIRKMWQSSKDVVKAGWALPRLLVTGKMDGGLVKALGPQKAAQLEQWWNEFIENGGETGFTRTLNAEKAKGEVRDMIRHMLNGSKDGENRVRKYTIGLLEWIGRYSEDISRFAAYCQQRAQGESVLSSIQEAKNVTVNFNVKGGSDLAANMRAMYSFFNASMQGINRMRRLATEHPKRFSAGIAAMMLGGAVLPWLNMALFAMLGGDDDDWRKYEELSEYTANHNMIIYVGNHKFVSIPWSQELAPFNALGNIWFRQQMGWNKGKSVAEQWGDMFVDLSPVSVASGNKPGVGLVKTVMPSFTTPVWEALFNEDFTGAPLYKDNRWNQYDAGWEKAYEGKTSKSVIDASRWLDEKTGIDINPAIAEHLFSGVLGGMGRSGDKLLRYFSNGFQLQDAPFIRTMMFDSKKQGYIGAVQREYGRNAYEVLPEMKAKAEKADAMEFARLVNTEEYKIADVVSKYKTGKDLEGNKTGEVGIDKMEKEYKKIAGMSDGSEEYREQLEEIRNNITERKMEMLDEIQQVKYENSGDLRRYIMDVVNEVERKSKDKNGD